MVCAALLAACGGPEKMNGFSERDARARTIAPESIDACSVRQGRLVVEVESALVREYPHAHVADALHQHKQPLLLLWVRQAAGGPGATVITPMAAPEEYRPGDPIRFFEGRRILDQPLRLLAGRRLEVRLAENNRTVEPRWHELAGQIGHGALGAAGGVGLPAPPSGVFDAAVDLLQKLDRDDLILIWSAAADEVMAALGPMTEHRALRYRLATARVVEGAPSAELSLLAYLEPEPGCP
jgi:hypothetical protein